MNLKRKFLAIFLIVIFLFAIILTINYLHKKRIYDNINRLRSDSQKERKDAVNKLVKIGKPAVEPLIFSLNYDSSYVKHGTYKFIANIIKRENLRKSEEKLAKETCRLKSGAIETLGLIGEPRAVETLVKMLLKNDSFSSEASIALGRIGEPSVPVLINHLEHPDDKVKILIIETLGKTKSKEAVSYLVDILRTRNKELESYVTTALIKIGKPAVEPLGKILQNKQEGRLIKCRIIKILGAIKEPESIKFLLAASDSENSNNVFWRDAVDELKRLDYPEAIPAFIEGLDSKHRDIRNHSYWILKNRINEIPVNRLIILLDSKYLGTKCKSIYLLEKIKSPESVEPLIKMLKDKDKEVRRAAASALGVIGDSRAVIPLAEAMIINNDPVCFAAYLSLSKINDDKCLNVLLKHLNIGKISIDKKIQIIYLLGDLKDKKATKVLIKQLKSKNEHVRSKAVDALGKIGDRRAVEPLLELLSNSNDGFIRSDIIEALGNTGDTRAVQPIINNCRHNRICSKNSILALGKLKNPKAYSFLMDLFKNHDYRDKGYMIEALGYYDNPVVFKILKNAINSKDTDIRSGAVKGMCHTNNKKAILIPKNP